jgi:hypothetical protein
VKDMVASLSPIIAVTKVGESGTVIVGMGVSQQLYISPIFLYNKELCWKLYRPP